MVASLSGGLRLLPIACVSALKVFEWLFGASSGSSARYASSDVAWYAPPFTVQTSVCSDGTSKFHGFLLQQSSGSALVVYSSSAP